MKYNILRNVGYIGWYIKITLDLGYSGKIKQAIYNFLSYWVEIATHLGSIKQIINIGVCDTKLTLFLVVKAINMAQLHVL